MPDAVRQQAERERSRSAALARRLILKRPIRQLLAMCANGEYSPNTVQGWPDLVLCLRLLALLPVDLEAANPERVDQFAGWRRRNAPGELPTSRLNAAANATSER